jgi:4'-phosphopantetheinyl transferase
MRPRSDAQVEVWRAHLDRWRCARPDVLSEEERARAKRFRFDADRARWMKGRILLRLLLGNYLQGDPREIPIELDANDKPAVRGSSICFNLSHSDDLALYAFTWGCAIGIDVEQLGRRADVLRLAERALGLAEGQRLRNLPDEAREREFLRSWVRHEAALKCRGGRLGAAIAFEGLSQVELDLGPDAVGTVAVDGVVGELQLLNAIGRGASAPADQPSLSSAT